ncbi:Lrp/AsnC ligand binding domain-containing protein [Citricoccus sp. NPDC079358]|uniref:Lrp/AsnC ligand binding domain-containing protein n=1 Tax=Citricoccus sp. NPDC079358 TaxID=3154653 RepID=UPI00344EC45B
MPEVLGVFVTSGTEDFLLHVAVPDNNHLYAFVIDRLTAKPEIADVRTSSTSTSAPRRHCQRPVSEDGTPPRADGVPRNSANSAPCGGVRLAQMRPPYCVGKSRIHSSGWNRKGPWKTVTRSPGPFHGLNQ